MIDIGQIRQSLYTRHYGFYHINQDDKVVMVRRAEFVDTQIHDYWEVNLWGKRLYIPAEHLEHCFRLVDD